MSEIQGVIQEVKTKQTSTGKTVYDLVVGGATYGFGFFPPKAKAGDYVKFSAEGQYNNVTRGSLKVNANKPPPDVVAAAVASMPKAGGFDNRQDAISRQAASNTAVAFMTLLQSVGGLPVSGTKGKIQESLETILHGYEQAFYERNTGVAWKDISPTPKGETAVAEATVTSTTPADEDWN